jgi:hypothetical protein
MLILVGHGFLKRFFESIFEERVLEIYHYHSNKLVCYKKNFIKDSYIN